MRRSLQKTKEEARRLFLSREMTTNAEIAARLGTKPHTVGNWRRQEKWDDLLLKIERKAAEGLVEKIASDRITLNLRHYRLWDFVLSTLQTGVKAGKALDIRDVERLAGILERAQKGQRLAKGLSATGETEEQIRAESEADIKRLIDTFIDSVKEYVQDEETRDKIRRRLIEAMPDDEETA